MSETQSLHCISIISKEKTPLVMVKLGELEGTLNLVQARKKAIDLIRAISISETEAGIAKILSPEKKGFGKPSSEDMQKFAGILHLIRSARPEIDEEIQPIFGMKTQLPLIDYFILGKRIQLDTEEALDHASNLLECAEAAECDSFIYGFAERYDISKDEVKLILLEFAEHRKKGRLENLLKL